MARLGLGPGEEAGRAPQVRVVVYPCLVQGPEAPAQIARAIDLANARQEADLLIVCRGGGSLEDLRAGVLAVQRQLNSVLEGQGLRRIESVGRPFDAHYHDAIGTEATGEFPEDTVTFEFEPAYEMGNRVVRHARVKVAKPS